MRFCAVDCVLLCALVMSSYVLLLCSVLSEMICVCFVLLYSALGYTVFSDV